MAPELLTEDHFKEILAQAHARAYLEKGRRHQLEEHEGDQAMWSILRLSGIEFATGQMHKKLHEYVKAYRSAGPNASNAEILDVIVYATMLLMWINHETD